MMQNELIIILDGGELINEVGNSSLQTKLYPLV